MSWSSVIVSWAFPGLHCPEAVLVTQAVICHLWRREEQQAGWEVSGGGGSPGLL